MPSFVRFLHRFSRFTGGFSFGKTPPRFATGTRGGGLLLASGLVFSERKELGDKPQNSISFTDGPLTHQFVLKQASVLSVEAASRVLTHTVIALQEENESYCQKLKELISILEMGGDGLPLVMTSQQLYEKMISLKSQVNSDKKAVQELHLLFVYVKKLMDAAAETSFLVGADYASVQASERLHSGEKQVEKEFREREHLEAELLVAEADHMKRTRVKDKVLKDTEKEEPKLSQDKALKDTDIIIEKETLKNVDKVVYEEDIKISTPYEKLADDYKDKVKYSFDEIGDDDIKISVKAEDDEEEEEEQVAETDPDFSEDEFNFPLDRKQFEEKEEKYKLPTF